ncbi:hypothetical protein [Actinophytocola sp.]|uniref:hypothetical protein n=1 Tax=Actinophytocola sp. TaxID=1872138 RepID=UPI003D6BEA2B
MTEDGHAPRWVKVTGIVVAALAVLAVVALLFGGEHGPGRHAPDVEQSVDLG